MPVVPVRAAMTVRTIRTEHVGFQVHAQLVAEGAEFGDLFFGEAGGELRVLPVEACFDAPDGFFAALAEENLRCPAVVLIVHAGDQGFFLYRKRKTWKLGLTFLPKW